MSSKTPRPVVRISSQQDALRVPRKRLAELAAYVAAQEGVRLAELDLAVVDDDTMADLNRRHLRHAGTTDVLSFDMSGAHTPGLCVQLIVSGPVAKRSGPRHGLPPTHELMLYVIHGLLHQMGYDDDDVRGGAKMHAREEDLLARFLDQRRKR
ncbi:MAG: rRNA maturation RNase YbeY [Phycisphaerae bacterium]